jgi:hypothetical protein
MSRQCGRGDEPDSHPICAPKNYEDLAQRLKANRALEKMREMFGSFRVPNDLHLMAKECGMANAWYQRPTVTICYEYVDDIQKGIPKGMHEGISQTDAMLGQFVYVVAYEMGHAMFDTLNVPLFGRPEDDADQFATYMMLLFGKGMHGGLFTGPRMVIRGTCAIRR